MRRFETINDIPEDATPEERANFWQQVDELELQYGVFAGSSELFEEAEKEAEQLYQEMRRRIQLASHSSGDEAEKEASNKKLERQYTRRC